MIDEAATIRLAQAGDDEAFGVLIREYHQMAKRVAQQILRTEEAADDAVQEAMHKAYRALPGFEEGNFRAWLLRIVTNTCYDHLRRAKRKRALSLDELVECGNHGDGGELLIDPAAALDEQLIQQEAVAEILAAIDNLSPWHRNAVWLIDVHGYDYEAAAAMIGAPLGTVKSRLSRGRAVLRERIAR